MVVAYYTWWRHITLKYLFIVYYTDNGKNNTCCIHWLASSSTQMLAVNSSRKDDDGEQVYMRPFCTWATDERDDHWSWWCLWKYLDFIFSIMPWILWSLSSKEPFVKGMGTEVYTCSWMHDSKADYVL